MRDFLLVLKFELQTMVRKKSFLISTVLVAAAAFVLLSIPSCFSDDKGTDDSASEKDKTMLIYDGSGILKTVSWRKRISLNFRFPMPIPCPR